MLSNNYKIVIIGESIILFIYLFKYLFIFLFLGMVGKTSILLRYIKGEFVNVKDRTVNTNCITKMLTINEKMFMLNIWVSI